MAPRKKRNTKGAAIAQAILEQYQPQTKEDMQVQLRLFPCSSIASATDKRGHAGGY